MTELVELPEVVAFALLTAREHFGEIVETVARAVHGVDKTLKLIRDQTKLAFHEVRNALVVLIQHDIVHVHKDPDSQVDLYGLSIKALLIRIRFPQYVEHVQLLYKDLSEELSLAAGCLIQQICLHGKIKSSDLIAQARQAYYQGEEMAADSEKLFERALNRLTVDHFCTRATPHSSAAAENGSDSAAASIPRKRAAPKKGPSIGKRRKVVQSKDMPMEMQMLLQQSSGGFAGATTSATKEDVEREEEVAEVKIVMDAIWSLDSTMFHLQMRNNKCVDFVSELINEDTGIVLESAMKAALAKGGVAQNKKTSCPITQAAIRDATPSMVEISSDMLKLYLDTMAMDNFDILTKVLYRGVESADWLMSQATVGTTVTYRINYASLVQAMKQRDLECIVYEKFGLYGVRVFRTLQRHDWTEQQQLSELAMIPKKKACSLLYQLNSAGFVKLQEVPKAPDHTVRMTIFLWAAELNEGSKSVVREIYKTMTNLTERLSHEHQRFTELQGSSTTDTMTKEQIVEMQKMQGRLDKLEGAILHLDEEAVIFIDFDL